MGPLGLSGRSHVTLMDWLLVATAIKLVTAVGSLTIEETKNGCEL